MHIKLPANFALDPGIGRCIFYTQDLFAGVIVRRTAEDGGQLRADIFERGSTARAMNQLISLEHSDAYAGCIGNTPSALHQQIHGIAGVDAVARNYTLNFNDGGQGLGRHSTLLDGEGIRKQRLKRLAIEALMCIHGTLNGKRDNLAVPVILGRAAS